MFNKKKPLLTENSNYFCAVNDMLDILLKQQKLLINLEQRSSYFIFLQSLILTLIISENL